MPNFIYEAGDMIIIETLNSFDEWTALPYIFGVDVHIVGSYEEDGTVWICYESTTLWISGKYLYDQ